MQRYREFWEQRLAALEAFVLAGDADDSDDAGDADDSDDADDAGDVDGAAR